MTTLSPLVTRALFIGVCSALPGACAVASGVRLPGEPIELSDGGLNGGTSGTNGGVLALAGRPSSGSAGGSNGAGGRSGFGEGGIIVGEGGIIVGAGGIIVGAGGVTEGAGGDASGGAPAAAGGAGTPAGPPAAGGTPPSDPPPPTSTTTHLTTPGGRGFLLHVPAALNTSVPVPLVFVHHGYNGSADQIRELTHFDNLADENGFVVAFPEGAGATWNAGLGVCGFGQFVTGISDDFTFVSEMIATIAQSVAIDRRRVFTTGFSMGGYFANNIGCNRPDLVRGIAPHSGGGPPAGCQSGPMPALILHGTLDSLIWYMCGQQARDAWVAHNGCSSQVDVVPVKGGSCEWSRGCPPGGQVTFCHFEGMDHGWAGATGKDGGGTQYADASRIVWEFFSKL